MATARRLTLPALFIMLVAVLACSDNPEAPQTGLVRGRVTRIYSGQAVPGAMVDVGGESTTTDAQGRFLIKQVLLGDATILVRADLYQDLQRPVVVGDYQSLDLELTPRDTLMEIGGRVTHRIDGPLRVRLEHSHGSVWTDADGRWSLTDVPMGPLTVAIDNPPYNHFSTEVLVHSDGQEFMQVLTRDSTVTWWITDDTYVFLREDSLNANRGISPQLLVTEELGRTAMFSLTPPDLGYHWAELVAARLDLHGRRRLVDDEDLGGPLDLTVTLAGLDGPFLEGAVDFYNRPGFYPQGTTTVTFMAEPRNQPLTLDLLPVIQGTPVSFWAAGMAIRTNVEQSTIVLLSTEYGSDAIEVLDRPRATYRLRF